MPSDQRVVEQLERLRRESRSSLPESRGSCRRADPKRTLKIIFFQKHIFEVFLLKLVTELLEVSVGIDVPVTAGHVTGNIADLLSERSVGSFESESVGPVVVQLVDLLQDLDGLRPLSYNHLLPGCFSDQKSHRSGRNGQRGESQYLGNGIKLTFW